MIKINKTIEVAKISEYNTNLLWKNIDIEAFVEMIKEDHPNMYEFCGWNCVMASYSYND